MCETRRMFWKASFTSRLRINEDRPPFLTISSISSILVYLSSADFSGMWWFTKWLGRWDRWWIRRHPPGLGTSRKGEKINGRSPVTFLSIPRSKSSRSLALIVVGSSKAEDRFFWYGEYFRSLVTNQGTITSLYYKDKDQGEMDNGTSV